MTETFSSQGQGTRRQRQEQERLPADRVAVVKAVTNVTTSDVTLHTVTADKYFFVKDFGVCNIAGATIAITVYVVPEGAAAGVTNKVYDAYSILANDSGTLTALIGSTLSPGDFIVADTDNATGANFWLDGVEFSEGLPDVG